MSAGVVWGAGGFMSQENLSGGLLVLIFSLGLYGPVCGRPLKCLARFAGLFLGSGAAAFGLLIAGTIGVGHTLDVLRQASAQSALVMAGVSNSVWSDNVGLTLTFEIVHGWWEDSLRTHGAVRPVLQTYGFAVLLMVVISLLAGYLGRSWQAASGDTTAVRLEVRRRGARRLCAASLRAVALRPLPSRRTVLSPAVVSAGAAGLRLAPPAAGPRARTAAAGVGRADRRSRDRRPVGAHPPR